MKNQMLFVALLLISFKGSAQWNTSGSHVYYNGGNVGIGTAAPETKLDVQGGTGVRIVGANAYEANLLFGNSPGAWMSGIRVYDNGDAEMRIWHMSSRGQIILSNGYNGNQSTSYPTDGMFIVGDAVGNTNRVGIGYNAVAIRGGGGKLMVNGNVGIGTASPASKLHISNSVERETFRIYKEGNTSNYLNIWQGTGGSAIDPIGTGQLYLGYDQTTNVSMNGSLGIGTTSPSSKLVVDGIDNYTNGITIQNTSSYKHLITAFSDGINPTTGSALQFKVANNNAGGNSAVMTLKGNGNVGIGTSTPSGLLELKSSNPEFFLTSSNVSPWAAIRGNTGKWLFGYAGVEGLEDISIGTQDGSGGRTLSFAAGGAARMRISANGNVGIGTTTPAYKLDVSGPINASALNINGQPITSSQWLTTGANISYAGKVGIGTPLTSNPNNYSLAVNGTIGARDVRVEKSSTTWPDYVFEKNYNLPSLNELENYIQEHNHLEDVPSANEVKENGYSLNEMDVILLKKVEELSLYIIQQQKEIQDQQKQIDVLKSKVEGNK